MYDIAVCFYAMFNALWLCYYVMSDISMIMLIRFGIFFKCEVAYAI